MLRYVTVAQVLEARPNTSQIVMTVGCCHAWTRGQMLLSRSIHACCFKTRHCSVMDCEISMRRETLTCPQLTYSITGALPTQFRRYSMPCLRLQLTPESTQSIWLLGLTSRRKLGSTPRASDRAISRRQLSSAAWTASTFAMGASSLVDTPDYLFRTWQPCAQVLQLQELHQQRSSETLHLRPAWGVQATVDLLLCSTWFLYDAPK